MTRNNSIPIIYFITLIILLTACNKNDTRYFGDEERPGIAIFSNTGNNLLSCYVDNKAWRTVNRILYGYNGSTNYEVNIRRSSTNTTKDTMEISWYGFYMDTTNRLGYLNLYLAMPHNFTYKDFSALNGKRLQIDGSNGYFTTTLNNMNGIKGTGNIYFLTAQTDSVPSSGFNRGSFSGLLDVTFPSFKVTNGRFDHVLTTYQISNF